jgi:hypothetical protein
MPSALIASSPRPTKSAVLCARRASQRILLDPSARGAREETPHEEREERIRAKRRDRLEPRESIDPIDREQQGAVRERAGDQREGDAERHGAGIAA